MTEAQKLENRTYQTAEGHRVEVSNVGEEVEFFPQGGGLHQRMKRTEFDMKFAPALEPQQFALVSVTGDWFDDGVSLPAYSNGLRWNRWVMPHFTREAAMRLTTLMDSVRYDEARDAFVARVDGEDDYVFTSVVIRVNDNEEVTYPIGAGCWCWENAEPAAD
ncbi:hypothetical protein [Cupriavidus sp. TMH.W2]|uniref:hypothetical protein n=1 Tax=Cupriavidus sp. TMH.W2 TaxID=3434465 RepID=UPI003D7867BF